MKSSLQQFYCCHYELVDRYEISISQMTINLFPCKYIVFFLLSQIRLLPNFTIYVTLLVSYQKQELRVQPRFCGGIRVAHLFSFLWCVSFFVCLRSLSCVLRCLLGVFFGCSFAFLHPFF